MDVSRIFFAEGLSILLLYKQHFFCVNEMLFLNILEFRMSLFRS